MPIGPETDQRTLPRQRVLKEGKLISHDKTSVIDVKIRDLNERGARVQTSYPVRLPENFGLLIVAEKLIYPAATRWQKGNMIGLEFVDKPQPIELRCSRPSNLKSDAR